MSLQHFLTHCFFFFFFLLSSPTFPSLISHQLLLTLHENHLIISSQPNLGTLSSTPMVSPNSLQLHPQVLVPMLWASSIETWGASSTERHVMLMPLAPKPPFLANSTIMTNSNVVTVDYLQSNKVMALKETKKKFDSRLARTVSSSPTSDFESFFLFFLLQFG